LLKLDARIRIWLHAAPDKLTEEEYADAAAQVLYFEEHLVDLVAAGIRKGFSK